MELLTKLANYLPTNRSRWIAVLLANIVWLLPTLLAYLVDEQHPTPSTAKHWLIAILTLTVSCLALLFLLADATIEFNKLKEAVKQYIKPPT